ncbi:MAG TPA: M48 family metallopeptidase [Candidatus Acidoferrales bacterium]|nr:M48 family metallopeptidase [Candidatus Acidoferrales bacterium]
MASALRRDGSGTSGLAGRLAFVAVVALAVAPAVFAARTQLKPAFNLFSPQQDIEIGEKLAAKVPAEMPLLNDRRVDDYLNKLGRRLAAHTPGYQYPYQYRAVNSPAINAFALPGGDIYVNRGAIDAADTESELAGVMAHETSHVALRHGTNQASKAYLAEIPAALLGGWLGNQSSIGAEIAQLTTGVALGSLFLKYSRDDETQADVLGTQILYDSGYDPRALARFFERIEAQNKTQPVEFFSDHPNPDHRIERVTEEVENLGGLPPGYRVDSPEFHKIKDYLRTLPPPPRQPAAPAQPQ